MKSLPYLILLRLHHLLHLRYNFMMHHLNYLLLLLFILLMLFKLLLLFMML
jgi:hypothetical protein